MKPETHGSLKLTVSDQNAFVQIEVARIRSAAELMDPMGRKGVREFIAKSGCSSLLLDLSAAGMVSTQMIEWLARQWLPSVAERGLTRLAVVTASQAHRMFGSVFESCCAQVPAPQAMRFFTQPQQASGTEIPAWFAEVAGAPARTELELAVHAFGGVPFVCVDFPYIASVEEYKQALVDREILDFISQNNGKNLLLNFTASQVFGAELPDWIKTAWLGTAVATGVERILIALPAQVYGMFSKVLRPASLRKAGASAELRYCGETEVFDTGEALNWFKGQQAA